MDFKNLACKLFYLKILLGLFILTSCKSGCHGDNSHISSTDTVALSSVVNTPHYNVFIETSGSMSGYLNADPSDFVETVTGIVTSIKSFGSEGMLDSLKLNYLGTTVVADKVLEDFNQRLKPSSFQPLIVNTSDFHKFFDVVLNDVTDSSVSVLATDMIFSPTQAFKNDIFKYLNNQKNGIQDKFDSKLDSIEISTLIIKYNSRFNGSYIDYKELPHKVDIERPYYVTIVGKSEFIDTLISKIDFKKFKGFEAYHLFKKPSANSKARVIQKRDLITGSFEWEKPATKLEIFDAQDEKGIFQFPIAVDLTNIIAEADFLTNKNNYKFSPESSNYEIVEVKKILDQTEESTRGYTHIIVLKTSNLKAGTQIISFGLKNSLPNWIQTSSTDNDINIATKDNEGRTFGFDKLIEGIYDAYNNKYQNSDLFNVKLKITK